MICTDARIVNLNFAFFAELGEDFMGAVADFIESRKCLRERFSKLLPDPEKWAALSVERDAATRLLDLVERLFGGTTIGGAA